MARTTEKIEKLNPKESEIDQMLVEIFAAGGIDLHRMPLGGVRGTANGKMFFRKNPLSGFPDRFGFYPNGKGRLFGIEVKSPRGVLSADQEKWRLRLLKYGCGWFCVRDVETAKDALESVKGKKRC
jgi:hypothetical protein